MGWKTVYGLRCDFIITKPENSDKVLGFGYVHGVGITPIKVLQFTWGSFFFFYVTNNSGTKQLRRERTAWMPYEPIAFLQGLATNFNRSTQKQIHGQYIQIRDILQEKDAGWIMNCRVVIKCDWATSRPCRCANRFALQVFVTWTGVNVLANRMTVT